MTIVPQLELGELDELLLLKLLELDTILLAEVVVSMKYFHIWIVKLGHAGTVCPTPHLVGYHI